MLGKRRSKVNKMKILKVLGFQRNKKLSSQNCFL